MNNEISSLTDFVMKFRCGCSVGHIRFERVKDFETFYICPNGTNFKIDRSVEPSTKAKEEYWDILQRLVSFEDDFAESGMDLIYFSIVADYLLRKEVLAKLPENRGISSQSLLGHLIETNTTAVFHALVRQIRAHRAEIESSHKSDFELMGYDFLLERSNNLEPEITIEASLENLLAIKKNYGYKAYIFRFPMDRDHWLNQAIRFDDRALALRGVLKRAFEDLHKMPTASDSSNDLEISSAEADEQERKLLRLREQAADARAGNLPESEFEAPYWHTSPTWVYWPNRWGKSGGRWQKYGD